MASERKTATECLRELLDERGVKWRSESYPSTLLSIEPLIDTYWQAGNAKWRFTERPDGRTYLSLIGIWPDCTPEQAVAATLGSELGSGKCESRWYELFGTPEKAARTMAGECCDCCECVIADYCEYGSDEGCLLSYSGNYDALLEWLRGGA